MLRVAQDDTPRDLIRSIADVVGLVEPRLLDLWKSTGITFGQRRVLRRLRDGSRSPGWLAGDLGVSGPTLTRHLQRLEDAGLIKRSVDGDDRRRVVVELTEGGRRSLADNRIFADSALALAARDMTAAERRALITGLGRLIQLAHRRDVE